MSTRQLRKDSDSIPSIAQMLMTVMLDFFFGVPQYLIRSGLWAKMKPGERDLYICLMHRSERYRTRELKLTDADVRKDVGTAPRTLCNARKRLQERGLIQCRKIRGNQYVYVICNPQTGESYPGNPKTPIQYQKKPKQLPVQTNRINEAPPPVERRAANESLHDPLMTEHGLSGVFDEK